MPPQWHHHSRPLLHSQQLPLHKDPGPVPERAERAWCAISPQLNQVNSVLRIQQCRATPQSALHDACINALPCVGYRAVSLAASTSAGIGVTCCCLSVVSSPRCCTVPMTCSRQHRLPNHQLSCPLMPHTPECILVSIYGHAGIADVDTREITRRLRDTGALNGIITTDTNAPVEELVEKTKSWSILGKVVLTH